MASRGSRAERDADFRRIVDNVKQRHNISDVVARDRKVIRAGREKKALCAFHSERSPSMQLNDAKGTFYCFGCGSAGDIVEYVERTQGIGFLDALRWLGAAELPIVDPRDRAKAAAEDAADRAAAIADAQYMWSRCIPASGTRADRYLREARGLTLPLPPAVRYGVVPVSRDESGNWRKPYPAVVLACTTSEDLVVGLQRIFLRDDGTDKRWGKRSKFSLGRPRGYAVRLRPSAPGGIVICEGPEDGLSLAQELPDRAVWIALGTAMMPEVELPASTRSITIAGQNDKPGQLAVAKAAAAMTERGVDVLTTFPDARFKDWNDQLRGILA